ncbi:MAG: vitamin B12-dependent ribonucleotide reductase, partial [Actinobacteria bacterium]|nr:vitamin B12-dependent ribonucleotide reductase [Actinomycetota bacterium]
SFSVQYQNANNSVRVTDEFMQAVKEDRDWDLKAVKDGRTIRTMKARDLWRQIATASWECADPGLQFDTTINKWHTAHAAGRINGSNPCSEYMHIDNSACNLASINLLKYLNDDDTFDVEAYRHTIEVIFTAQEILVGNADYPTEKIAENSRLFRQLGIGYANIGALLMALGMPYDSEGGRAWAAVLTSMMTGHAYATSARIASRMGPFAGFTANERYFKKLVGGGNMTIVNQTVPRALAKLGYEKPVADRIVQYIDTNKTIVGSPDLRTEHLAAFACSMGDNVIHYEGHVRMMGAVQPFLSGAISKTVNMPETATVEDIEHIHMLSWELGLKAVAIYRDNCKVGQPLSTMKKDDDKKDADTVTATAERVVERTVERIVTQPVRQKLPRSRRGRTFEFRVADCKGFANVGEYEDGRPGEIFLTVSKQGSTLAGIMDSFAKSVSYGLQYGVPLHAFVEAFINTRFEPAGMTDDPDIRMASSIIDYLFRRLAVEYMTPAERAELGIFTRAERMQPTLPGVE